MSWVFELTSKNKIVDLMGISRLYIWNPQWTKLWLKFCPFGTNFKLPHFSLKISKCSYALTNYLLFFLYCCFFSLFSLLFFFFTLNNAKFEYVLKYLLTHKLFGWKWMTLFWAITDGPSVKQKMGRKLYYSRRSNIGQIALYLRTH